MPQPCIATSSTVSLTVNGSPGVLQADARLSATPNRLVVATDGLLVRDLNARIEISANTTSIAPNTPTAMPYQSVRYTSSGVVFPQVPVIQAGGGATGLSAPVAGVYRISFGFRSDGAASVGTRQAIDLRIYNSLATAFVTVQSAGFVVVTGTNSATVLASASIEWTLAVGEFVSPYFVHSDTVSRILVGDPENFLSLSYVGPGN